MACLTDTAYKVEGKTVLYIPEEDINTSLEKCAKNKELVARLESKLAIIIILLFRLFCLNFLILMIKSRYTAEYFML